MLSKTTKLFVLLSLSLLSIGHMMAQSGTLDASFGGGGYVQAILPIRAYDQSLAIQNDGKIVCMTAYRPVPYLTYLDYFLIRYNTDGSLDNSFGTNGEIHYISTGNDGSYPEAVLQPNGKIILCNTRIISDTILNSLVIRLNTDGSIDSSFGVNGTVLTDLQYSHSTFNYNSFIPIQIGVKADGGFLVAVNYYTKILSYSTDGIIDSSFGRNGFLTFNSGPGDGMDMEVMSSGKFILTYYYNNAVLRYNTNGSLDSSFFHAYSSYPANYKTSYFSAGVLNDESVIIAVDSNIDSVGRLGGTCELVKLNPNGVKDSSFGTNGESFIHLATKDYVIQPRVSADGKIFLLANVCFSDYFSQIPLDSTSIAVIKFNANGVIDSTFANDGAFILDNSIWNGQYSYNMELEPDGKVVVLGRDTTGGQNNLLVFRLLNDLSLGVPDVKSQDDLVQIYPNPIHDHAIVSYQLAAGQAVSIGLYDMEGCEVQEISSSEYESMGKHRQDILLNDGLAAGDYIIKIAGSTINTARKITVRK